MSPLKFPILYHAFQWLGMHGNTESNSQYWLSNIATLNGVSMLILHISHSKWFNSYTKASWWYSKGNKSALSEGLDEVRNGFLGSSKMYYV